MTRNEQGINTQTPTAKTDIRPRDVIARYVSPFRVWECIGFILGFLFLGIYSMIMVFNTGLSFLSASLFLLLGGGGFTLSIVGSKQSRRTKPNISKTRYRDFYTRVGSIVTLVTSVALTLVVISVWLSDSLNLLSTSPVLTILTVSLSVGSGISYWIVRTLLLYPERLEFLGMNPSETTLPEVVKSIALVSSPFVLVSFLSFVVSVPEITVADSFAVVSGVLIAYVSGVSKL